MKEKKMSPKEWLKEYAKDMGYEVQFKDPKKGYYHYYLIKEGKAVEYPTIESMRNVVLRALMRYVDEHTTVSKPRKNRK